MKRILVIDDDELLLDTVREMLEGAGHVISVACDGNEGLALLSTGTFDLVITDIIMPNKEGIETIHDITERQPDLPIIAISGGSRMGRLDSYLPTAHALGAVRTLAKPFRLETLLEAVTETLAECDTGSRRETSPTRA